MLIILDKIIIRYYIITGARKKRARKRRNTL